MPDGICCLDGCERPRGYGATGYCDTHRFRVRRTGSPGGPEIAIKGLPKPPCSVPDCERPSKSRGWCTLHYWRWQHHGDPEYNPPAPVGERNNCYRGDAIGHGAAHSRVVALRGRASQHPCVVCGGTAAHWAYDHKDPDEKPNRTTADGRSPGPYSVKPQHYQAMCVPCHKRFDLDFIAGSSHAESQAAGQQGD